MNRLIVVFVFLVLIVGGVLYYYYQVLPDKLGDAIVEERLPNYIPKAYKEKAYQLKKEVIDHRDDIESQLAEKQISNEELIDFVDKVEYRDVEQLIENAEGVDMDSAELAFQYIKDNFDFEDFPIDSFREDFLTYYNREDFEKLKELYHQNRDQLPLLFPVLKKSLSKFLTEPEDSLNR